MYLVIFLVYFYNFTISLFINKIKKIGIYFIYLPFILFLAWFGASNIRKLSLDFDNYQNWMSEISYTTDINFLTDKDPGFSLIVKIIQFLFGVEYFYIYFFFIITSLFFKIKLSLDFLPKIFLSLFLILCLSRYFIIHDINQIRAGLVIIIGTLFTLKIFDNRINILLYCMSILILSSIHSSIILLLAIVFLDNYYSFLDKKKFILFIFGGGFFCYSLTEIISNQISSLFSGYYRYSVYLESGGFKDAEISIFSFFILIKILIVVINIIIWGKISLLYKKIVSLSCVGLFFALMFSKIAVLGWRFLEIFAYFDFLSIFTPLIFLKLSANLRLLYIVFWIFMSFLMIYSSWFVIFNM